MRLELIVATVMAALSTWETVKCIIFWREWRERRDYEREE